MGGRCSLITRVIKPTAHTQSFHVWLTLNSDDGTPRKGESRPDPCFILGRETDACGDVIEPHPGAVM